MKKYASPHEAEIRKQVAAMLASGKDRVQIVDRLHQTYYDRTYLNALVEDVVNPKDRGRLTGAMRTLAALMTAYGALATVLGIVYAIGGRFYPGIVLGPMFLVFLGMVRLTNRVSTYVAIASASGIMLFRYVVFFRQYYEGKALLVPLLFDLAFLGCIAWTAFRAQVETTRRELVIDRTFEISGGWTDQVAERARTYWEGRGYRMRKATTRGLRGHRSHLVTPQGLPSIQRLPARLLADVEGLSSVRVKLAIEKRFQPITEADRVLFRLELLEFQSVVQGAGPFEGIWESVAKLQSDAREGLLDGRILEHWAQLLDELEGTSSFGPSQHARIRDFVGESPFMDRVRS